MKKILVGVCSNRKYPRFWKSFFKFMKVCGKHYNISSIIINDTFLPDAQNICAENFLNGDYDYLLLLDDDHWGHSREMLDCLIKANTYVATMKTYSRHYPYVCAAWNKVGHGALVSIEDGKGYVECDLTGFPMTLISRLTFDKLEKPYFRPLDAEGRTWNSDVDFFERLKEKDIKPTACFQYCLNHDKITENNVWEYRTKERLENNNMAWFKILTERQLKEA